MALASGWAYHAERAWKATVRCGLACDRAAPWVDCCYLWLGVGLDGFDTCLYESGPGRGRLTRSNDIVTRFC